MNEVPLTSDQRTLAMLAHLLGLFTSFVGPLVIWILKKDEPGDSFVADQAKEALNFQVTLAIAFAVSCLAVLFLIGLLILPVVWVAGLAFTIVAAVKAQAGERYRYPVTLRLI